MRFLNSFSFKINGKRLSLKLLSVKKRISNIYLPLVTINIQTDSKLPPLNIDSRFSTIEIDIDQYR